MQMTVLDGRQVAELERWEAVIDRAELTYIEIGEALRHIKEDAVEGAPLWQVRAQSFDQYCQERWGFGDNQANSIIRSSLAVNEIAASPRARLLPASEWVARPLSLLLDEHRDRIPEVWEHALAEAQKLGREQPTRRMVRSAVSAVGIRLNPPRPGTLKRKETAEAKVAEQVAALNESLSSLVATAMTTNGRAALRSNNRWRACVNLVERIERAIR